MLNKQRSLQKGRFNAPLHCIGGISYKLGNSLVRAYCEICGTHGSSALLLLYLLNRGQEGFKLNAPLVWSKHQQLQVLFPLFSLILYCFNWTESSQQSGTNPSSSAGYKISQMAPSTPLFLAVCATRRQFNVSSDARARKVVHGKTQGWKVGELATAPSVGNCRLLTARRAPELPSLLHSHSSADTEYNSPCPAELFYKLEDKSQIQK